MPVKQTYKLCCDSCDESIQMDINVVDISISREGKIELPYYLIEVFLRDNNWYSSEDCRRYSNKYVVTIKCPKCK